MSKQNLRAVPCECTLLGAIEDAYSQLEELQSECQEIVDNASEGLSQTQRIQTFEETADALGAADSVPDVPADVADITVRYTEDRRKSKSHSRATRCAEACELLHAATDTLSEWLDTCEDDELKDECQSLIDELEEMLGNAEGCEFPGMYG